MNYNLLKEEIEKKGYTYEEMASHLNMSVSTFYRKIGEQTSPFSIKDADALKNKLGLSKTKASEIFFGE